MCDGVGRLCRGGQRRAAPKRAAHPLGGWRRYAGAGCPIYRTQQALAVPGIGSVKLSLLQDTALPPGTTRAM